MEDLKQIQEFFSKPIKENSRRSPDFILTEPAEIKYTESFGSGIKAPGVLHHANEGAFLGAEGAYIIVLPGGTFYVDEDKEEAIPIYPIKDQSREFQLALDYTPFSPKYETWKSWIKRPETLGEAYIVTYAKNKGEKPASAAYKLRGSALAFMRDLEKDGYTVMLTQRPVDGVDEALDEYNTGIYFRPDKASKRNKKVSKSTLDKIADIIKKATIGDYEPSVTENEENMEVKVGDYQTKHFDICPGAVAVYKDIEVEDMDLAERAAKLQDALFAMEKEALENGASDLDVEAAQILADQIMAMAKMMGLEKEHSYIQGHVEKIKGTLSEGLTDYEEKEADYDKLYSDYAYKAVKEVAAQKGFSKYLKSKDNPKGETDGLDTKTMNKILMNVIKDIEETKRLGEGMIEEELCAKGKAYRKKRMAAGEKSSAYLSGRAVKVCKGQMKG